MLIKEQKLNAKISALKWATATHVDTIFIQKLTSPLKHQIIIT